MFLSAFNSDEVDIDACDGLTIRSFTDEQLPPASTSRLCLYMPPPRRANTSRLLLSTCRSKIWRERPLQVLCSFTDARDSLASCWHSTTPTRTPTPTPTRQTRLQSYVRHTRPGGTTLVHVCFKKVRRW